MFIAVMHLFIYFSNTTVLISKEVRNIILCLVTKRSMDSSVGIVAAQMTHSLNPSKIFLAYLLYGAESFLRS